MSGADAAWSQLTEHVRSIETLRGIAGTLGWDEQTMMPPSGAALRGAQQALLARLVHERLTDERLPRWTEAVAPGADGVRRACLRNLGREVARARNVPAQLVERLAEARSRAFAAWVEAKRHADWDRFRASLEEILELTRRRVEAIDPARHPYEVALEGFDPGITVDTLRPLFARLAEGLRPLLDAIDSRSAPARLMGPFDETRQRALHLEIAAALGYDRAAGRLDHAEHPFTSGHGPGDVRITTHFDPDDLLAGLSGTIHETGHALYEQGLPHALAGTTVAEAASYGLHESQSRFWENTVGRSLPFCRWLAGRIEAHFPGCGAAPDLVHRASCRVVRGPVRVEADEVTYDLHVAIRFELELALFEGRLRVSELPEAWNARYQEVLGVTPPDDARGVLQDVHWASGAFGYFPSYTLGNLWAASLGRTLEQEHADVWERIERGDFGVALGFLRERVHARGHLEEAEKTVDDATGGRDGIADLLDHLWGRYGALHGVKRPPPARRTPGTD